MKKAHIYTFSSQKTLGCTTLALNLAWEDQKQNPQAKILFFQCTEYPDLHYHLKFDPQNNFTTLIPFYHEGALDTKALQSISPTQRLTILPSPPKEDWEIVDLDFWDSLFGLIHQNFDRVYLDLHLSTPEPFFSKVLSQSDTFFSLETLEPSCQEKAAIFRRNFPELLSKTIQIYAQVPRGRFPKDFKSPFPNLGALPCDEKALWYEVFTQKLVVDQKRSALGKTIKKILPSIISLH